jgi:phospholipid/cholesterol/gamma-HCH transport system substrate-binding protein
VTTRQQLARVASFSALAAAAIIVVFLLISSGSTYVLHVPFRDAGQLVKGDLVTVAGHQVGSVGAITLTNDGLADVELNISDGGITPIHSATIAQIGQLSLTGVANRFVGLSLSGAGPAIPSGGTLPLTQSRGIVDLDAALDALTPRVRASIQQLLRTGAYFVSRPTDRKLNAAFRYLNPALSQSAQLGAEVVADKFALQRLVASTADVSTALAGRDADLAGAVTNTAAALREVASQRAALEDSIARAPAVLRQSTGVLANVDSTLHVLNPTLTDLQPVAPKLATLLRTLAPTANNLVPTIRGLQQLVPKATRALGAVPATVTPAIPAVESLTTALGQATPILAGLRPYTPDVVAGFFNGVGGATGGFYDANGHYLKSLLTAQATLPTDLTGLLGLLGGLTTPLPPLTGGRTRLLAPCPGGGGAPAADGSNPWTSPDVLPQTGNICNPADDQRP